ncbi:ABC transporter ATP-binding protein [Streptosporangium sp. NPDC049376]|uniref:ABC transporter ATP-binding protein n=1 Tax=Streptosporangium sp. NPDC049376 TaxID=3366192 RepID=UPI0037B5B48E
MTHKHGDRLLWSLTRGAWAPLAVATVSVLTSSAAALALPAALAAAVDAVLTGRGTADAVTWLALVIAVATGAEVTGALAGVTATASATSALRSRLTAHVLGLDTVQARRFPTGELANRLVSNTAISGYVPLTLLYTVTGLLTSIGGAVGLFLIDWRVGLTFLAGVPVAIVVIRVFVARVSGLYDRYQDAQGRLAARLTDALAGIRTVRASGTADREISRVLAPLAELSASGHALWRAQARSVWQLSLFLLLVEVLVLAVTGLGIADGRLEPGRLLAAAGYTALALAVVERIDSLMDLAHARSAARRVGEVLALPAQVPGSRPLPEGAGALSFRAVTVAGDGPPLLDGVDLEIPAGALTAVVGRSGAGKSTLALLAGRLMDPDHGQVLLDGLPLTEADPDALRNAVAYAFERPVLLGGDLLSAVAYGLPADASDVREAARAAHVDGVVSRLPQGYGTPADTAPLSGGELQRLGLARALVRRARLTVLDDATSSLDTATEAQVIRTLTEEMRGRTRLVVAHRATTAARADLVVWLDDGRVRARGPHRELWRDPAYRALFTAVAPVSGASASAAPASAAPASGVPVSGAGREPTGGDPLHEEEPCPVRP